VVIDTSAVVAMVGREPERATFLHLCLAQEYTRFSAAGYLEAAIVLDRRGNPTLSSMFDRLMADLGVVVEPVTFAQASIARAAHRRFGRGSGHPARLNYGDCFAYALAVDTGEPLLFKGDDFARTDVVPALPRTAE
jgi:ribonuclease VapC